MNVYLQNFPASFVIALLPLPSTPPLLTDDTDSSGTSLGRAAAFLNNFLTLCLEKNQAFSIQSYQQEKLLKETFKQAIYRPFTCSISISI